MDEQTRQQVESATFQKLLTHLRNHPEAQNIDLMLLADFCRNCLAKWYRSSAEDLGHDLSYDEAREIVYGMPYSEWKEKHQAEATPEQLEAFQKKQAAKAASQ